MQVFAPAGWKKRVKRLVPVRPVLSNSQLYWMRWGSEERPCPANGTSPVKAKGQLLGKHRLKARRFKIKEDTPMSLQQLERREQLLSPMMS